MTIASEWPVWSLQWVGAIAQYKSRCDLCSTDGTLIGEPLVSYVPPPEGRLDPNDEWPAVRYAHLVCWKKESGERGVETMIRRYRDYAIANGLRVT
jgi:hypothetical protein